MRAHYGWCHHHTVHAGVFDQRAVTNPVVVRLRRGAGFVLYYVEQRSNPKDPYGTTGYSVIMARVKTLLQRSIISLLENTDGVHRPP